MQINERQIALRAGGNFDSLNDFLDRRIIKADSWRPGQILSGLDNVQAVLLDASYVGAIAIATDAIPAVREKSIVAVKVTTPFNGSASPSIEFNGDPLGRFYNLVQVRNATTFDPIVVDGKKVYGLIQADSTVSDGDLVAATGAKNLQISFVTLFSPSSAAFQNVAISGDIQFTLNYCIPQRFSNIVEFEGLQTVEDLIESSDYSLKVLHTRLEAASFVPANTEISLLGGTLAVLENDPSMNIGNTAVEFIANTNISFLINGIEIDKRGDLIDWISGTSFKLTEPLDAGDLIFIKKISLETSQPISSGSGY